MTKDPDFYDQRMAAGGPKMTNFEEWSRTEYNRTTEMRDPEIIMITRKEK